MSELKQNQLNKKPSWATHYYMDGDDLYFCSSRWYGKCGTNQKIPNRIGLKSFAKPIAQEAFDISNHKFNDDHISHANTGSGNVIIYDHDYGVSSVKLNKDDAIAIAKSLGVTKEDF